MVESPAERSENDDTPVSVNFFNESPWQALLLWFDYEGRLVLYASVGAGRSCGLFSFMTHPWMAVDSKSFLPMTLTVMNECGSSLSRSALSDSMSVFTPSANYLTPQNPGTIQVLIHLPGT
ncbi:hypothetical protein FGIG_12098 [Fasciola gigantica]|uniref:von Hippel-Lindau disease tumour suppressor beta domain-containing protein n=1 Tax=Fasciola gigantica TaxID=46835 RepID=A0A504YKC8_FASGI|nr:hypothetical protein FGIG_12098 [Fasciola gigantica]